MFLKHLRTIQFIRYSCLIRYIIVHTYCFFLFIALQNFDGYSNNRDNQLTPSSFISTPNEDYFHGPN